VRLGIHLRRNFECVLDRNFALVASEMKSTHNHARTPLDGTFDAFVETILQEWHVPGLSIAVIDGEKTFAKVDRWEVF
jgi:CubicO group peptidase (beta-lactamase class C family)